jgi:GPH family glycoside/pentoside/hexuronide:cation symporter
MNSVGSEVLMRCMVVCRNFSAGSFSSFTSQQQIKVEWNSVLGKINCNFPCQNRVTMSSTSEINPTAVNEVLPAAQRNSPIVYGLGSFGLESAFKVFTGFYIFYYVDKLGLAVAMAAIINFVYAIWDAVNDPLVGYLSDNTRSRWGRRRPWLLSALPFYVGILVLVYAVPEPFKQGGALFWYALIIFILFEGAYTVMQVNYSALFPELFQGFHERARAGPYYQGLCMLGELVGFSIPPIIYARYGFVPMSVVFAGIAGITLFVAVTRNTEDPEVIKTPRLNLKAAFEDVLKDRPFWLFSIALTFLTFTTGIYTLATPFWVKYSLSASPQTTSLIFAIVFSIAIVSVSVWGRLVRTMGIKRTWLWAIVVMAASAILLGLAPDVVIGGIGAAVAGGGLGGIKVCREMIMANFVDRSLKRTGHRREGLYYSLLRVVGKLSKILEALALALLGVLFGYVSGENPGPQPNNAFRFLMSVFPLVFMITAGIISRRMSFKDPNEELHIV